jgi:hypothetical protein
MIIKAVRKLAPMSTQVIGPSMTLETKVIGQSVHGACEQCGKSAEWLVHFDVAGQTKMCRECYRAAVGWECGAVGKRSCGGKMNYGLHVRCVYCGWVKPDQCRRCGSYSPMGLIKLGRQREGHPCHICNGNRKVRELIPCEACSKDYTGKGNELAYPVTRCLVCNGRGGTWNPAIVALDPCESCEGSGNKRAICHACKGLGMVDSSKVVDCSVCEGKGICLSSSGQWAVTRVALNDLPEAHRDSLREFVDSYLCWKCINPDINLSAEPKDMCIKCEQAPMEGSLYCLDHDTDKGIGALFLRIKSIDSPNKFVSKLKDKSDEEALAEFKKLAKFAGEKRADGTPASRFDRAIELLARKMRRNAEDLFETYDWCEALKTNRDRLDLNDPVDRLQKDIMDRRVGDMEARLKLGQVEYKRHRHIAQALSGMRMNALEARVYQLWDPRSTPEYYGEPDWRPCKSCFGLFNAKVSWLCPHCTEVSEIALPQVFRTCRNCYKEFDTRATWLCPHCSDETPLGDAPTSKVYLALATDNREIPLEKNPLRCQSCDKLVDTLYRDTHTVYQTLSGKFIDSDEVHKFPKEDVVKRQISAITMFCVDCATTPWKLGEDRKKPSITQQDIMRREAIPDELKTEFAAAMKKLDAAPKVDKSPKEIAEEADRRWQIEHGFNPLLTDTMAILRRLDQARERAQWSDEMNAAPRKKPEALHVREKVSPSKEVAKEGKKNIGITKFVAQYAAEDVLKLTPEQKIPVDPKDIDQMSMAVRFGKNEFKPYEELQALKENEAAWKREKEIESALNKQDDFWMNFSSWRKFEGRGKPMREAVIQYSRIWTAEKTRLRGVKASVLTK